MKHRKLLQWQCTLPISRFSLPNHLKKSQYCCEKYVLLPGCSPSWCCSPGSRCWCRCPRPAPPPPRTGWGPPPVTRSCSSHSGLRSGKVFFLSGIFPASRRESPSRKDSREPGKSKTDFIVDRINTWFIPPQAATQNYSDQLFPGIYWSPSISFIENVHKGLLWLRSRCKPQDRHKVRHERISERLAVKFTSWPWQNVYLLYFFKLFWVW